MDTTAPFLFAGLVGLGHAFEADHLLAVSSLVTRRDNLIAAAKDGVAWGLGHTTTILLIGIVMIAGRVAIDIEVFGYLEAFVGVMLILLGALRLRRLYTGGHPHDHAAEGEAEHTHRAAYGVGLIHGLAGSGALVLLVMTEINGSLDSFFYLIIFGLGSVLGMLIAAGVLGLPFTKRLALNEQIGQVLTWISSIGCILYGGWMLAQYLG